MRLARVSIVLMKAGHRVMERLTVVVKPEKNSQEDAERQSDEDLAHGDVPRVDNPVRTAGRHERDARWQRLKADVLHAPDVHEAREEDERQRRAVVLKKHAHHVRKKIARAENAAQVCDHEYEEGCNDGQVKVLALAEALEDLDALLEIDEGDVEAEDVAGEAGHVVKEVAGICDREDPVEDEGPPGGVS